MRGENSVALYIYIYIYITYILLYFLYFMDILCFSCFSWKIIDYDFAVQVLHAFATEGAHCNKVREILNASEVSISEFTFSTIIFPLLLMAVEVLLIMPAVAVFYYYLQVHGMDGQMLISHWIMRV